ncbi:MAG: dephospho-CoA kinase [Daejeonella sp.]|nr:dephospho-CoA kinase [Daejeonella sp.]MDP2412796.1 dephospho-CoA kinase [Daejeonella sp.]
MLKIGITGGIGSGKTTVCKVFELLGVPVFYADDVAKSIMHTDPILKSEVLDAFGQNSYTQSGELNRSYISSIVFNDKYELEKLNSLVHPAVFRAFDTWVLSQKEASYVIKEAALLYESDAYKMCDQSVLVISPIETRISRVKARDGISAEDIQLRMNRQFSDEQKMKFADHVLNNDERQLLIPQIIQLHQQFLMIGS